MTSEEKQPLCSQLSLPLFLPSQQYSEPPKHSHQESNHPRWIGTYPKPGAKLHGESDIELRYLGPVGSAARDGYGKGIIGRG